MSKAKLRRSTGVSTNTTTKLNRDEEVTLSVFTKIYDILIVDIGDIIEYTDHTEKSSKQEEN